MSSWRIRYSLTARFFLPLVLGIPLSATQAAPVKSIQHPLDPLLASEFTQASTLLKAHPGFPGDGVFAILDLKEPDKTVLNGKAPVPRLAYAVVFSRAESKTWEGEVDLSLSKVSSWNVVEGVQPMVLMPEYDVATKAVRENPEWQAAMRLRGITDFEKVAIDGWAAGPAFGATRRTMRALSFYIGNNKNYYNRPVEGVVAVIDMTTSKVVEVVDTGVVPLPEKGYDLDAASTKGTRKATKPLVLTQPQGASYQVKGQAVEWQGWHFRFSFHSREGLVLHQIGYEDKGQVRPILHRASLSEMIVPYGDPSTIWNWRAAFDVGEYGFGNLASPLAKGGDVPTTAQLFDATMADGAGAPLKAPGVVALYERDGGVLWKHYDYQSGHNNVRRSRQLVISSAAAIGNYDYLLSWIFHQDGTLELDAVLTGMLLAKGTALKTEETGTCPGCTGHLVGANIVAPNHQHFFNFRLDFDVDGAANSLAEMNQQAMGAGPLNPQGNGFVMAENVLANESGAQRDLNPQSNRRWRVINPSTRNALGNHTGYMLMPGGSTAAYLTPESPTRQRAAFLNHAVWGTRFHASELFAAGNYPNQAASDGGLSRWANDGEGLAGEDLVVWYTMGVSHVAREEEWPIMNAHHVGFSIMPSGFFDRNPAFDVRN